MVQCIVIHMSLQVGSIALHFGFLRIVFMVLSSRQHPGSDTGGLSPHKITPRPGVHNSFQQTARAMPQLECSLQFGSLTFGAAFFI